VRQEESICLAHWGLAVQTPPPFLDVKVVCKMADMFIQLMLTDIIASKCKFTSPPSILLLPPSTSLALSSAAFCRMATAVSAVGSPPFPSSLILLVSFLLIAVEIVESTRLWLNGNAPIENYGAAQLGDNAPITPATAHPILLTIAAARLGNVAVSLCGLWGGGGLLGGLPSSNADNMVW
jgi:hypothetical protein